MKILQVVNRFYPFIGGTENYVFNLSKELVKLGHQVTVICAREPNLPSGIVDGINIIRLRYPCKIANTNITLSLPLQILRTKFDIIHNYLPHPWSADWAAFMAAMLRKPTVLTYNNDIPEKGAYKLLTYLYNRTFLNCLLRKSHRIILTQENYKFSSPFLSKFKNKDKFTVIPCGVDENKFQRIELEQDKTKRIFFLSVLDAYHRYKGLDFLLKSFAKILNQIQNIKLIIGGEGTLKNEYEEMARKLNISKNVEFVGEIADDQLSHFFNKCDIFVLPSIASEQEGFGIVALEAMACGKPVIVTEIVGVAEEIRESNAGIVVRPRDSSVLSNALSEILSNDVLARQMGENGRNLVQQKYTWSKIAQEISFLYESLL